MSSPLPPDPYVALGVAKDADINAIRAAHRKLVLKHHPDRIRDESEREKGRAEFEKAQQAYEILSDPTRRARYDDECVLAELQRERMMMRNAARPTVYTSKSATTAPPPPRREYRDDPHYYEERTPPSAGSYFDEPIRGTSRKAESYEPRRRTASSTTGKPSEKRERSKWDGPVENISFKMAFNLKNKAAAAKERVRENQRGKAEVRDREKRKERSEKESGRRAAYVGDYSSDDSDTVVASKPTPKAKASPKPKAPPEPEPSRSRHARPPRSRTDEDDSHSEQEKWERHHMSSREYIAESQKRPGLSRTGSSDAHIYWTGDHAGNGKKSGSDSDRKPAAARRTPADSYRSRPSMPAHSSAPNGLRDRVGDREPQRSSTNTYLHERDRESRRDIPILPRANTMPVSGRSVKKDGKTHSKGSNLKHAETQDSGYSSQSTPEMRGESPPRERSRREKSTKYTIVDAETDDESASSRRKRVGSTILDSDEDSRRYRTRSPESMYREPDRHDRERNRTRDRADSLRHDTESRPRPERGPTLPEIKTSMPRTDFIRDASSPRGSPPVTRHRMFGEVDEREANGYGYRVDPSRLRTASHPASPSVASYSYRPRDEDDLPGSTFFEGKYPGSRRPSAARAF